MTSGRHIVLLVDDDEELLDIMSERLTVLGFMCVTASSKEDALRAMAENDICVVLTDRQILADTDSIQAHPSIGMSLLSELRAMYPGKDSSGHNLLPIVMMTGYAPDSRTGVDAMKSGADDYLVKPGEITEHSISSTLDDVLRKSGRLMHDKCREINQRARRQQRERRLALTGGRVANRHEVLVDGKAVGLTGGSYVALLRFALSWFRAEPVSLGELHRNPDSAYKVISRLTQDIGDGWVISLKDKTYKLRSDCEIEMNCEAIAKSFPNDATVFGLCEKIKGVRLTSD